MEAVEISMNVDETKVVFGYIHPDSELNSYQMEHTYYIEQDGRTFEVHLKGVGSLKEVL